jgi:hypothetical protein
MQEREREVAVAELLIANRDEISPDFWYWLRSDRILTNRKSDRPAIWWRCA